MPTRPESPGALALVHNPKWIDAKHTHFLDQALVYLDQRKAPAWFLRKLTSTKAIPAEIPDDELLPFTRLVVQEPPRHGKSEHVSRYFTAWYLGRHPEHHVILTSYGDNYAATWGRKSRDVLEAVGEQAFGVTVSKRTSASNDWELTTGGGMNTAGVGGAITGRGANALVVDDPVKDARDAASEVMQESTWDWWRSTAYTRLESDAEGLEPIALVIQTRWNEGDLTGRILLGEDGLEDDEAWYVLNLPALAEENDPLGRAIGEPLWPERRSLDFLERIKRRVGSYWWSALYQQRPTPLAGNIFPRSAWQWYDQAPEGYHPGGIFLDTAGYDSEIAGDWWAFASVIRVQKDLYWLNAKHGRWAFNQAIQELRDERDRTGLPIYVERTALALPLIQSLQREMEGVIAVEVKSKKEFRALAAQPNHEAGNFYLPRKGQWTADFIDEHAAFPNGAHDDWVDTTSAANSRLYGPMLTAKEPVGTAYNPAPFRGP
jgi:predicted phage terminase large subunit-like protein